MRTTLACLVALVAPVLLNVAAGGILDDLPSEIALRSGGLAAATPFLLTSAGGAFAATCLARRASPAALAAVFPLVASYQWWHTLNSTGTALAVVLAGVFGAAAGAVLGVRYLTRPGSKSPAA